jgi:hypothetical protein
VVLLFATPETGRYSAVALIFSIVAELVFVLRGAFWFWKIANGRKKWGQTGMALKLGL